jgi:hypothetical protein
LPQRSAGYPRSPSPTRDPTLSELSTESRRWTETAPATAPDRCHLRTPTKCGAWQDFEIAPTLVRSKNAASQLANSFRVESSTGSVNPG